MLGHIVSALERRQGETCPGFTESEEEARLPALRMLLLPALLLAGDSPAHPSANYSFCSL